METTKLGRTGLPVSRLGLGGVEIDMVSPESPTYLTAEDNARILNQALDSGITVIDTAECYGNSEEQIGNAIGHRRAEFVLFTKCGHAARLSFPDWNPRLLRESIDRSLSRLRTSFVDVLFLHSCGKELLRRGEVIEVAKAARQAGKARFIGYSGDGEAARYALTCGDFDVLETSVNLVDQEALALLLPLARRHSVGVVAKRPIANAVWRYPGLPESRYLHSYWERYTRLGYDFAPYGLSPLEAALRFVAGVAEVDTAIVGTGRIEHFRENLRLFARGPLPAPVLAHVRSRWRETTDARAWTGER